MAAAAAAPPTPARKYVHFFHFHDPVTDAYAAFQVSHSTSDKEEAFKQLSLNFSSHVTERVLSQKLSFQNSSEIPALNYLAGHLLHSSSLLHTVFDITEDNINVFSGKDEIGNQVFSVVKIVPRDQKEKCNCAICTLKDILTFVAKE